jgi:hypothetical protein
LCTHDVFRLGSAWVEQLSRCSHLVLTISERYPGPVGCVACPSEPRCSSDMPAPSKFSLPTDGARQRTRPLAEAFSWAVDSLPYIREHDILDTSSFVFRQLTMSTPFSGIGAAETSAAMVGAVFKKGLGVSIRISTKFGIELNSGCQVHFAFLKLHVDRRFQQTCTVWATSSRVFRWFAHTICVCCRFWAPTCSLIVISVAHMGPAI